MFSVCVHLIKVSEFPRGFNHTNIVLMPKLDDQKSMKDRHPISLCNVSYKVLSKVLANRLKPYCFLNVFQKCNQLLLRIEL